MDGLKGLSQDCASLDAPGLLVERTRLVRSVVEQLHRHGVVFVCAPAGFGKTALLMQCTAISKDNPESGDVRLLDAHGLGQAEMISVLGELLCDLRGRRRPLVAIDNLPAMDEMSERKAIELFRSMRAAEIMVLVACTPRSRSLIRAMGDSAKVNAPSLFVRPHEYAKWVNAFGLSSSLDVYGLTQGIPALVVSLRNVSSVAGGGECLEREVAKVYRAVIEELRTQKDPLLRVVCLMVMLGSGSIRDLERAGVHVKIDLIARLKREYPIVALDADTQGFRCLGTVHGALDALRADIATSRHAVAIKAARILLRAGRADDAVALMGRFLTTAERASLIAEFPSAFALRGHALFIRETVERVEVDPDASMDLGLELAAWMASLCMGDYRAARALSADIRRRANEVEAELSPEDWEIARAMGEIWRDCKAISLPEVAMVASRGIPCADAARLRDHARRRRGIVDDLSKVDLPEYLESGCDEVVIPSVLCRLDHHLVESLREGLEESPEVDDWLAATVRRLTERKLGPLASWARMVASARRLMQGRPMVDERAFSDASRVAVRESNLSDQLLCLTMEGWQYMLLGQAVNAEFRAQQVQKLAGEGQRSMVAWAALLERVAGLYNSSRLVIRQEVELCDLSQEVGTPEEAWSIALHLSAARCDADLSAWYSMHRVDMLAETVRARATLAMHILGEKADSIRRLLPRRLERAFMLGEDRGSVPEAACDRDYEELLREVGQVSINLFGGFRASRNGHVLTEEIWKRRKATFLAARLAMERGSFLSRRVIMAELWPDLEYRRARQNLYVTLTALRQALCQQDDGPQYIVCQAGAIAMNEEYVSTDLGRFEMLAREILLKRTGVSSRGIVEACLRLEEVYKGPMYVPDIGDVTYFSRLRRSYATRFVDCMVRGIEAALEEGDLPSASWLMDAAMKQAPTREDVVRLAMRVMGLEGRRREVVELYNSHLYYLKHELNSEPEDETRELYRSIIEGMQGKVML
ncbi:MAG: BTAD domain-containing putative transcriptional regulator [Collinsella sp.]|nr:BTAD domain-containing putative transcriptional regulator [Collinsella sp.]